MVDFDVDLEMLQAKQIDNIYGRTHFAKHNTDQSAFLILRQQVEASFLTVSIQHWSTWTALMLRERLMRSERVGSCPRHQGMLIT